jgi:hypothetical protein
MPVAALPEPTARKMLADGSAFGVSASALNSWSNLAANLS